ncbi:MAG: S9 family peptidase [Chloroflexi bacterium]|nr:S9 family peptidase [Chloroflexota bacterium]
MTQVAPYGAWASDLPISLLTEGVVRLAEPRLDGDLVYWLEGRPAEGGISVLVRRWPDGATEDVSPLGVNVRTRVHEYGGGAYLAAGDLVVFSNFRDGRLYRARPGRSALPITPDEGAGRLRYADLELDAGRGRLIVVREDHRGEGEPLNAIAAVPLDGGPQTVLFDGTDFVSAPRLSPDGRRLAWLSWNHPNMPWDGMDLWVADVRGDGTLGSPRHVAGSQANWTTQPLWSPDGRLHFVDERTGWLNLYRRVGESDDSLAPAAAEFAWPEWQFAAHSYGFAGDGRVVAVVRRAGHDELWSIAAGGEHRRIDLDWTELGPIRVSGDRAVFTAAGATRFNSLVLLDLASGEADVLRTSSGATIDPATVSLPEPIEFPTAGGRTAHGLFYAPRNPRFRGPDGDRPPLIVTSHGGPTSAAFGGLSILTQLFTSRGFAVLDVDYGGSTGYGREYRKRLEGQWGVVDVDDCVNGALSLAERGLVDGHRLAIRGGSASGYTTLCAVTFRDAFRAGVSYFGIGDLVSFDQATHKFESRYTQSLVGPFPETIERWRERSPLNFADRIRCPVLILQGLDDRIVPPVQAEQIVAGLAANGVPHAYLAFEDEDHGFRRAENIIRSFEAELSFYGQVFGFTPADLIEPIELVRPTG